MCLDKRVEFSDCSKKKTPTYSFKEVCEFIDSFESPIDLAMFMGIAEQDINLYSATEREVISQVLNNKVDKFGK